MKTRQLVISLLLLSACEVTSGIQVQNQILQNRKHKSKSKKSLVSIDVDEVSYTPARVLDALEEPMSDEFNAQIEEAFSSLGQKAAYQQLLQTESKPAKEEIELDNLFNVGYQGSIWVGQPSQKMSVIFDLGSPQAWVLSEKCKDNNCPPASKNQRFLQSQSKDFRTNEVAGALLQYGRGTVAGHPAQDRICFNGADSSCIENMSFLTVVKAKDIEALKGSGIFGLSPMPAEEPDLKEPLTHNVPGFVSQLRNSQKFNDKFDEIFSIYLSNDTKKKGKITFGGYDVAKYAKKGLTEKDIFWADQAVNENYWAINNKAVTFGNKQLSQGNQYAVLDNGMSFAMAPPATFLQLIKTLAEDHGIVCGKSTATWKCQGATLDKFMKLPPLAFTLVGNAKGETMEVEMPKHAYMKLNSKQPGIARLLISPFGLKGMGMEEGDEYWILGAQFLQNYYTIYDFDKKKVGLVESVSSTKDIFKPGDAGKIARREVAGAQ